MKTGRLLACGFVLAGGACGAIATDALPKGQSLQLRCEVAYLPSRSTWVREVRLDWRGRTLQQVAIDAVPVHRFSVRPDGLATAVDNERIRIDWKRAQWQSDFRGMATGQGRCEVQSSGA